MAKIPSSEIQSRDGNIFPRMSEIAYEEKQKPEYILSVAKAIYSTYANDLGDVPYSGLDNHIDSLRIIARGRQSADQYKKYFIGGKIPSIDVLSAIDMSEKESSDEASRKGHFTGMWEVMSVIPNIKTKVKGEFLGKDVDIKAFCTDMDANIAETLKMNKEWVKIKYKPILNNLRSKALLPPQEGSVDSYEALQDIKAEGGFKENYIKGIEQAISHTEDISDWKLSLKEKLFDDLFDIGCAFAISDYDYQKHKVIWKYIDPKNFGCQYSFQKDFSDSNYCYWFEYPSINNIRENQDKYTDGTKYGLTYEDLSCIANSYRDYGKNDNSLWYKYPQDNMPDISVCEMTIRWWDVELKKKSEYTNPNGRQSYVPYKKGHENSKSYKIIETREKKVYQCKWIVGTNYIRDFGCMPNQSQTLGFTGIKLLETSYIERLVPIAHSFAIQWETFINAMSKAQNDFYAFDAAKLALLSDGGKKYDPLKMIEIMRTENVFFYMGESQGGDGVPIKKIEGTLLTDIQKTLMIMQELLTVAEMLTGISAITMGATPDPNMPVRTSLASINSSNTAISYIHNSVMTIKTRLGEMTIPMLVNLLLIDDKSNKAYAKAIGEDDVYSIIQNKNNIDSLAIKLYPRPTDEMKERIVQNLQFMVQQGVIDGVMAMQIEYQLYRGGNFLEILHKVDYLIRKEKARIANEKQMLIREQTAGNERASQVRVQSAQAIEQARMQADANKEYQRGQANLQVEEAKFQNEIKSKYVDNKLASGESIDKILMDLQSLMNQQREQV
ncbi:hypothetical protein JW865_09360 [Candidatus Bathyarchaeota archaeon]|nr:hypothetical protein [Candidatus Bathyarchaeota archaeon]